MAKDNRKSSRVTKCTRFEVYAQRRTTKVTKTTAVAKRTNFSKFSPPCLIFSPFQFRELQEYINNKFGIITMTSVPEYRLIGNYPPHERDNIKKRHFINGNFAVVSFDNFDDRDTVFEAARQQNWNVQIFLHRGQRRAIGATAKTGMENFFERVSGPKKPNSNRNGANAITDPDVEMKKVWPTIRSNFNRRRNRSTVQQNSNTNATSQLDQDVDMDDAGPALPNLFNHTPFSTTASSFEFEMTAEAYDGDSEMSDSQEGYNSTPFTTPPTSPPVALTTPAQFPVTEEKMDVDDFCTQLQSLSI